MIAAITPVIQIVASGTDWPAIASGIAAGVVGVAGIVATYSQSKHSQRAQSSDLVTTLDATAKNLQTSIGADNERAELAARRHLYGRCISAFMIARDSARLASRHSKDPLDRFAAAYNSALTDAFSVIYEVMLSAPADFGQLASEALDSLTLLRYGGEGGDEKCIDAQLNLVTAMRKDLASRF
jgi:hypothetical protein